MTAPPGGGSVWVLRSPADLGDLAAFCARVRSLDAAGLVRLRQAAARLTAYSLLPLGVLVSRTVHTAEPGEFDRTVAAGDLLALLEHEGDVDRAIFAGGGSAGGGSAGAAFVDAVGGGRARDGEWRGTLPPAAGWRRVDAVPVPAIEAAVRAGLAAFESVRGRPDASAVGESLLDHEALTVSSEDERVVLPLRVLQAAWRMGFLGAQPQAAGDCVVSAAGRWVRLAAPHGSAYHQTTIGLTLS